MKTLKNTNLRRFETKTRCAPTGIVGKNQLKKGIKRLVAVAVLAVVVCHLKGVEGITIAPNIGRTLMALVVLRGTLKVVRTIITSVTLIAIIAIIFF